MSESEKSEIEKDEFFNRAENLNVPYQVELSEDQEPGVLFEGGAELLKASRNAEVQAMLSNKFGDKLENIAKADKALTNATLLITDHDDNFPGIDSDLIKRFFDSDDPKSDQEAVRAYDHLRDETLKHYGVDRDDYDKYVRFMIEHMFPGED